MRLRKTLGVAALVCLLLSCGSGGSSKASSTDPAVGTFSLGINVNTINWWDGSRPFANLIYGGRWLMQGANPTGGGEEIPESALDPNGWVKSAPAGSLVTRGLSVPLQGGEISCRFQGNGTLDVSGAAVLHVTTAPGLTKFRLAATYPDAQPAILKYKVDPANYIRNIDCRETGMPSDVAIAPEFVSAAQGFKVIRFMKWQVATEGNTPVTWATRNKPGDGSYLGHDGVPVEVMVETANRLGADPWFTVPWNADDDYVARFATYVRDHMAAGHRAYVEVSNEVWNGSYSVATQAANEAKAENLPGATGAGTGGNLERYAEKTKQVMAIWTKVFDNQSDRLVRVAAFQHVQPDLADKLLGYQQLSKSVDAVASAAYFGYDLTDSMTPDQVMAALPAKADEALRYGVQFKSVARKHGLRYVTYEAGQSLVFKNNLSLLQQAERDPRMYDVYSRFIAGWRDQIGDGLNLFVLSGGPSPYGAWGMVDYAGQPLSQAPKMRAARSFMH